MIEEEILMKQSKYSDAQIMGVLNQAENGVPMTQRLLETWDEFRDFLPAGGPSLPEWTPALWPVGRL
jgi:hypothetical protein